MKEFPVKLIPENKELFSKYLYNRVLGYLRKEITDLVLVGDENNYFDVESFGRKYVLNSDEISSMIERVSEELRKLGWKINLSFAGTGLFIYSSEKPPPSCFDDEF